MPEGDVNAYRFQVHALGRQVVLEGMVTVLTRGHGWISHGLYVWPPLLTPGPMSELLRAVWFFSCFGYIS